MDFLAITLSRPNGFWDKIIFGMESSVKNYALALILVTVIIKLIMVPFDFVNKYSSKKSTRKQAEMKPELDKINAKYQNDKAMLNQKTMEVYKSHNYNIMGTCVGMLIYLVFTMVVFWTLFASLNNISSYKIADQFMQVRDSYYSTYDINVVDSEQNLEEGKTLLDVLNAKIEELSTTKSEQEIADLKTQAEKNALDKYNETKSSFLWIENIWLADSTVKPVMSYKDFISKSKISSSDITETEYNLIISSVNGTERKNNGYFILAILAAGINYLSMSINVWISRAKAKKQGVDPSLVASNSSNKIMSIVMPIIMGLFTLFYNAAFGLYIVAGALITLITGPLVTVFVDMLEIEAIKREQNRTVAAYDRKRRK